MPNAFEQKSSLFIVSNGNVYYKNQLLELDAQSFKILRHISAPPLVACSGTTYKSSIDPESFSIDYRTPWATDKQHVYFYHSPDKLIPLQLNPKQTYAEHIELDNRDTITFYRDGHSIYTNSVSKYASLEDLFAGEPATFKTYATLWRAVIFHDQTGFYLAPIQTSYSSQPELIKVVNGPAQLVCLEADRLCLLNGSTLYYVFDDGTVSQQQIDPEELQCIQGGKLLSLSLEKYAVAGTCFNKDYFYNKEGRQRTYTGGYEEALKYTITAQKLEQKRLQSLERVHTIHKPLLIERESTGVLLPRWFAV